MDIDKEAEAVSDLAYKISDHIPVYSSFSGTTKYDAAVMAAATLIAAEKIADAIGRYNGSGGTGR